MQSLVLGSLAALGVTLTSLKATARVEERTCPERNVRHGKIVRTKLRVFWATRRPVWTGDYETNIVDPPRPMLFCCSWERRYTVEPEEGARVIPADDLAENNRT